MLVSPGSIDGNVDPVKVKLSKKYRLGGPMSDEEYRLNHDLLKEIARSKKQSVGDISPTF